MDQTPNITVEVVFLTPEEGGRTQPPDLSLHAYRPHLVVSSPDISKAAAPQSGLSDDYLGVWFVSGPAQLVAGQPLRCTAILMYHPQVDYTALQIGTNFTIREGPHVVGFGSVLDHASRQNRKD